MARKKSTRPTPDERRRTQPDSDLKPETSESGSSGGEGSLPLNASPSPKSKRPGKVQASISTDFQKAQSLAEQAWASLDPKRRVALAKEAISTSQDCSKAYLVLAEMARSRREALSWFEKAVEASDRLLGREKIRDGKEIVWGSIESIAYFRARLGLAEALWSSGRRHEASEHLKDILRLNPGDNQGIRYTLAGWLLNMDRLEELESLLDRFDEDSATWSYTKVLLAFRRDGDSVQSRKLLSAAKKTNKHVPSYILGRKLLPPQQPPFYIPGDEDDAILYVGQHLGAWKSVPGAVAWIRSKEKTPRRRKTKFASPIGPSSVIQARLRGLPSEMDAWQADFRQFARRVEIAGERVRPWMVLVSSRTHDLVLAHALTEVAPSPEELWDILASAMERPAAGDPHRPTELQVRPGGPWETLKGHIEAIGVSCSPTEVLDQVDYLFEDLTRHMAGVEPPGLLDMPGVTPAKVGRLFEAAAEFYRRAPWRALGYEAVIRIECDRFESGPWFAVIMGQSGLTLGLALYEDLSLLRRMWAGKLTDEEGAKRTVALTVTFDDESSIPEVDLESMERHGWKIAGPEAYPAVFRKERGLSMRPLLSWEIDLMDACLRILPDFVSRRAQDDTTRELVAVSGSTIPIELGLSWIEESY